MKKYVNDPSVIGEVLEFIGGYGVNRYEDFYAFNDTPVALIVVTDSKKCDMECAEKRCMDSIEKRCRYRKDKWMENM